MFSRRLTCSKHRRITIWWATLVLSYRIYLRAWMWLKTDPKICISVLFLALGAQTLDLICTTCEQNYYWIIRWGDVNNVWNMWTISFFFFLLNELLVKCSTTATPRFPLRLTVWSRAGCFWNVPSFSFRHTKSQAPLMWLITKWGNYASHHHTPVFRVSVSWGYSSDSGRNCSWFRVDFFCI